MELLGTCCRNTLGDISTEYNTDLPRIYRNRRSNTGLNPVGSILGKLTGAPTQMDPDTSCYESSLSYSTRRIHYELLGKVTTVGE
ncbi:hypothetical protein AG1IA_07896 [Rhizoctonia solani AG-1 IA]|uniref:Uncharacterized protein n=1 Tax=Thanatephorus cucumeris (strain AG1-IA) TaxID=983506 RepID=L8WNY1_THACA|nr:hypothetical protein AG1IA_07896 [Rhizoctonia solani AG-1 IA]